MIKKQLRPAYLVLIFGVLLIIAAAVIALTTRASDPKGVIPTPPTILVERISLTDAKAAFDSDAAIFLDVRAVDSFISSHIPGAINIPLQDLASRAGELDPKKWIITYCT